MTAMNDRWAFDDKAAFLEKIRELLDRGHRPERLSVITPFHVPETDKLLATRPSKLKFFTLAGALSGLAAGFFLTIATVLDWPLITGGKPLISLPPFTIIAFELTILLGALASFAGFLILSRTPSIKGITEPEEHDNRFTIILHDEEAT